MSYFLYEPFCQPLRDLEIKKILTANDTKKMQRIQIYIPDIKPFAFFA